MLLPSTHIERTQIWKSTLAPQIDDSFSSERELLRSAFLGLRRNVADLVTRIGIALPGLTVHEVSHLDALWETSSLIVGNNFQLSPLEGFVLGGAFLVHDSALCFEAFENGKDGLRNTLQWKDAFADCRERSPNSQTGEIERQADFIALRNLHARQAEKLLSLTWKDPNSGNEFYLLEDQTLRNHLGKLIGKIAASHHWDIEAVVAEFEIQFNALAGFPTEWRIDPVKLACILRCADAAHFDNERAPDFLFALVKRSGISFDHWKAQNRLAKVDIDQSDPFKATLLYTSTIDFKEEDSNSWFIVFDALCLLQKEIISSNAILEKRIGTPFKVNEVKGTESPENLARYIKATGWEPCAAEVHVGNVEKLIDSLGGLILYGSDADQLMIVLRELIQNSRDAIKARMIINDNFEPEIKVSLQRDLSSTWIIVEDNGIGMSQRVLTGPLLDFGTSFWSSTLVQSEFPGLRSSKFKSIGKFGIGFYSVFMVSELVIVSSRSADSGLADVRQLKFANGISLRPIITSGAPSGFGSSISTQVKLKLKAKVIKADQMVSIKTNRMGSHPFEVPFRVYLASLCAGLDVPVFYKDVDSPEVKVHVSIFSQGFDQLSWLTNMSFADFQPNSSLTKHAIAKNLSRLRPIFEGEILVGLAAISLSGSNGVQNFLSIDTVGGLASSVHYRDGDKFIGYLDHLPNSAKREIGSLNATSASIQKWAKEQLSILLDLNLTSAEKYYASASLCHFKIDPTELAEVLVMINGTGHFFRIPDLAVLSKEYPLAFLASEIMSGTHIETLHQIFEIPGYALIRPLENSSFLSLQMKNNFPENNFSILDCIYRAILNVGYTPVFSKMDNVGKNSFNHKIDALLLSAI